MKNDKPIGIFDSGLGGLSVVKEIIKILPNEDIIYFGDTARVPYGTKSKRTIEKFSCQSVHFLTRFRVKIVVVACNTSSSLALNLLKRTFKMPIVGVVEPGAKEAILKSKYGRIGVIGTRATISSGVYQKALKSYKKNIKIFATSCPLFVPLVEEGWLNGNITKAVALKYLSPLKKRKIDTLILGCTHYPLIKPTIKRILGAKVELIDSAMAVAKEVKCILEEKRLKCINYRHKAKYHFFVSDEPYAFAKAGSKFLGRKIVSVERVNNV
jgi:glutamate racemase